MARPRVTPFLVLSALLAVPACSRKVPPAPAKPDVEFKVYVSLRERVTVVPDEGMALSLDGKPIGTLTQTNKFVQLTLPADTFGVDLAPRIKADLSTTCGSEPFAVRPYYADKASEQEFRAKYGTPETKDSMSFSVDGISEAQLYVDNVGGKSRKLSVGKMVLDLPADGPVEKRIRVGKCAESKTIAVDGKRVGELSMEQKTPKAPPATLIDAVGGRCYRRVQHVYKQVGTQATGGARPPETYQNAGSYGIEHPHDFLKPSPKSYETFSGPSDLALPVDWRVEINRCTGTPKRGGPLR